MMCVTHPRLGQATLRAGSRSAAPRRRRAAATPAAFFNRGKDAADDGASSSSNSATAGSGVVGQALVSDGAIKSLSPEARRIFREAQDNIIELNKSRLRALEELKIARQKIAELEEKLESAVAEASQATAVLQQLGPAASEAAAAAASTAPEVVTFNFGSPIAPPAAAAAPAAPVAQQAARAPPQAPPQRSPSPPPQQAAAPPQQAAPADSSPTVTVVYETGWNAAFLHYNADGHGWTTSPGEKMENGNQQFPDKKVLTVPGRRLEFVINDGGNDWDKPWGEKNYAVDQPGVYRLKNGKVTKLA